MPTDIDAHADRALAHILDVTRRSGAPDKIVIATYATREDYAELHRAPDGMTYDDHMRTVKRTADMLTELGIADRVVFQDIEASEYWRWLAANSIPDSQPARGMFADLKYHGKENDPVTGIEKLRN